jgi:3-dehydroquinate synthetase
VKLAARIRPIPPLAKVPAARMWEIIQRDKKSRGGEVRWVLPTKIGRAIRGVVVPERVFNEVWQALPSFHSAGLQR